MKLIDKAAVVAEIEKRIRESMQPTLNQFWAGQISAFKSVIKILNTLEVKEVDCLGELSKYISNGIHCFFSNVDDDYCKMDSIIWQDYIIETAKHFFELELKASNPITTADQENEWNESSIKPPFTITMDGNKYSKPMLCYDKFGNYCIAQYTRLQTGYCGWYDGEEEVSITHWKELKAQKGE